MFYKQSLLYITAFLLLSGCASAASEVGTPRLGNGDLVLVLADTGDMSQAIAASTGAYDHVGIIAVEADGTVSVIDATPARGVARRAWADFAADNPRHVVMTVEGCDAAAAVERAAGYVGLPYDRAFDRSDSAIYCSELVQLCYLDAEGHPVFDSRPMNFLAADGTMPDYWVRHFSALGIDIPQGQPGTNPTDIANNPMTKPKE